MDFDGIVLNQEINESFIGLCAICENCISEIAQRWFNADYSYNYTKFPELTYSKLYASVLIEPLLKHEGLPIPNDYKFHVYKGHVRFIRVDSERMPQHKRNFFDPYWKHVDASVWFHKVKI